MIKLHHVYWPLGCEYLGYVKKLNGTDLVNKVVGRESSLVLSNMCQTNPVSRESGQKSKRGEL